MEGRGEVVVLSSNNYLGLAGIRRSCRRGSTGSKRIRRRDGFRAVHLRHLRAAPRARAQAAELSGTEAALTYVSCWNANEAVIPISPIDDGDPHRRVNHASIIDAVRLSRPAQKARSTRFRHDRTPRCARAAPRDARKLDRHRRRLLDGRRPREAARDRGAGARARRGRMMVRVDGACSGYV